MSHGVFCFRQDLRLDDQPALNLALKQSKTLDFLYVFDQRSWDQDSKDQISSYRAEFIIESLRSLKEEIESLGGSLFFMHGNLIEQLPLFMKQRNASRCYMQCHCAYYEKMEESSLMETIDLRLVEGNTLLHPDDYSSIIDDLPETFTKFRKKVEKNFIIRETTSAPSSLPPSSGPSDLLPHLSDFGINQPQVDPRNPFVFIGGKRAAMDRVRKWMWEENHLSQYKETRNGMLGSEFSSRLSPWLAQGIISPRYIYSEVKSYEMQMGANESTYWLIFELLWRDFFHFLSRTHGKKLFLRRGIHPERPIKQSTKNQETLFNDWKNGQTENDFVNANMNELRLTGWMSNRGRQNVASFLVHQLGVDWRKGANWFERQLIDFDPCNNFGNWIYLAGFGSDPRPDRYFNLSRQADLYDPERKYTKLWCQDN